MKIKIILSLICLGILCSCSSSENYSLSSETAPKKKTICLILKEQTEVMVPTKTIPSRKVVGDTISLVYSIDILTGELRNASVFGTNKIRVNTSTFPQGDTSFILFEHYMYFYRSAIIKSIN